MGSELVQYIKRWCDRCEAPEEGAENFRAEVRVVAGDMDRLLDLCGDCFEAVLGPLIEELGELGVDGARATRAATKAVTRTPQPMLPGSRRARPDIPEGDRVPCPFCAGSSTSESGLKQHMKVRHGLTWTEYQAGQRPTRGVAA